MTGLRTLDPAFFTIGDLKSGRIKYWLNEEYQRSDTWERKRKRNLWGTILQGLSIGVLFARRSNKRLEILDGQQRLSAIMGFFRGDFKTPKDATFPDKGLSDLRREHKLYSKVLKYKIWYIPVSGGTEDEVSQLFLRLQEGQPLTPSEILNVESTPFRNFVIELADHHLFVDHRLPIHEGRFAHRYVIAQCLYTDWKGKKKTKSLPTPPRKDELLQLYRQYMPSKKKYQSTLVNFDRMYSALGNEISSIKKSDFVLIYAFIARLDPLKNDIDRVGAFLDHFFKRVRNARTKPLTKGYKRRLTSFEQFKSWRQKGATPTSVNERFRIIWHEYQHWSSP